MWQVALRNASTLQQVEGSLSFLTLFPLAIDLLTQNLDLLGDIRLIIESYLLLDANVIVKVRIYLYSDSFPLVMTVSTDICKGTSDSISRITFAGY